MVYDYTCAKCRANVELMHVAFDDRDEERLHDDCGGHLTRVPHTVSFGSEAHQMHAVLSDGSKVKGHFGKTAKRRRQK